MGDLAAAFELEASRPGEYEITVYERDWRLGGKGASGRSVREGLGHRIEEHGLHVLMGFYDNVFEILNRCYSDLRATGQLPPATGTDWWNGVLHGMDELYFAEPPRANDPDRWLLWRVPFDPNKQTIGGPAEPLPSIAELALAAFQQFAARLGERHLVVTDGSKRKLQIVSTEQLLEYARTEVSRALFASAVQSVLAGSKNAVNLDDEADHKWFVALYVAGTNLIGMVSDVLWDEDNFRDRLDLLDYKNWIQKYNCLGLTREYLWESAPVNAVYDLVFSRNRGFAAGSMLYDTMLMLFHYRGHVFYKMAGGMGDIVFVPLYLWLSNRPNVQFKFFHELTDIQLSDDQSRVAQLDFHVALQRQGNNDPTIRVPCLDDHGQPVTLPCWPSVATGTVASGPGDITVTDFDLVVLAIPIGAITKPRADGRPVGQNLYLDPSFQRMATGMVTRGTRAVQLWFSTDLAGLGWPPPGESFPPPVDAAHGPVLGSYDPATNFNSWSDMTQVLPRETWGAGGPRNIAYLCDVDDDDPADAHASSQVHDDALAWLNQSAAGLWPKFSWDLLVDYQNATGPERFDRQYWRSNTDPAQHYVLGVQGTTALRLDPHGTRFSNLYLAGDWVKTPLNAGCVEGAAMGGRLAAQRILEQEDLPAVGPPPPATDPVPRYIVRDGDLPLLPPVVMGDVTLHGYVLTTSTDVLTDLLARSFAGTGVTCTPLLPIVLVTSVRADQIRSGVRPDDGYLTEAEFGFWLPVHLRWRGGSATALYLPYLFVDNPAALLAGREIYGFNKIHGQFRYASDSDIDPTAVAAQVLHTLAPDSRLDWLTVAAWTGAAARARPIWNSAGAALAGIASRLVSQLTTTELRMDFSLPALPLVFLKQFRDAADGTSACHQAAVLARATLAPGVSGGWLDCQGLQLALPGHATLDIGRTLGLPPTVSPHFGFWVQFSATVQPGQELPGVGHAG